MTKGLDGAKTLFDQFRARLPGELARLTSDPAVAETVKAHLEELIAHHLQQAQSALDELQRRAEEFAAKHQAARQKLVRDYLALMLSAPPPQDPEALARQGAAENQRLWQLWVTEGNGILGTLGHWLENDRTELAQSRQEVNTLIPDAQRLAAERRQALDEIFRLPSGEYWRLAHKNLSGELWAAADKLESRALQLRNHERRLLSLAADAEARERELPGKAAGQPPPAHLKERVTVTGALLGGVVEPARRHAGQLRTEIQRIEEALVSVQRAHLLPARDALPDGSATPLLERMADHEPALTQRLTWIQEDFNKATETVLGHALTGSKLIQEIHALLPEWLNRGLQSPLAEEITSRIDQLQGVAGDMADLVTWAEARARRADSLRRYVDSLARGMADLGQRFPEAAAEARKLQQTLEDHARRAQVLFEKWQGVSESLTGDSEKLKQRAQRYRDQGGQGEKGDPMATDLPDRIHVCDPAGDVRTGPPDHCPDIQVREDPVKDLCAADSDIRTGPPQNCPLRRHFIFDERDCTDDLPSGPPRPCRMPKPAVERVCGSDIIDGPVENCPVPAEKTPEELCDTDQRSSPTCKRQPIDQLLVCLKQLARGQKCERPGEAQREPGRDAGTTPDGQPRPPDSKGRNCGWFSPCETPWITRWGVSFPSLLVPPAGGGG